MERIMDRVQTIAEEGLFGQWKSTPDDRATLTVTPQAGPKGSITLQGPTTPKVGSTASYYATVTNVGDAAGDFLVVIRQSGVGEVHRATISSLAPGASGRVQYTMTVPSGSFTLYADVYSEA